MLVRFHSDAGSVIMFGDVASTVLKLMGQSGEVPGALKPEDVPAALERLKRAVGMLPRSEPASGEAEAEGESPKVSLRQRAFPVVELLERCAKKRCDFIWEGIARA
jgi:hypothetical protein